jgi:hypothetical protein
MRRWRQEAKAMAAVFGWSDNAARNRPAARRRGDKHPSSGVVLAGWIGAVLVPWAVLVALVNLFL